MVYYVFEARYHPRHRISSVGVFIRGLILLFTGLYAASDPFEFTQLAFPLVGLVLITDGILGLFVLDLHNPARGRMVAGLIRNTLEMLGGLSILGGMSVVRLAPQEVLLFWLAGLLALCGLIDVIAAVVAPQGQRDLTSMIAGTGLLAISAMLFLAPGAKLVAVMSAIGVTVAILGLVLIAAAIFQRS